MSDSKKKIIQKLGGPSARQIYNALVQIRTNIIKSKGGIEFLVAEGAIPKLIQLIGKSNCHIKGTIDIIFSILGNLCMNDGARKNVEQNRGISVIAEYFCECKTESIQNRSCRTLANLALSPSACEAIHQTEVTGKIVTLLKNTENKECQLTYCRAIRLLGRTLSQIEKLLNHDAVSAISKLLGCDDNEVKAVGLRALFELSKHGCSCQFANQVIGADIIKDMLNLSGSTDKTISHHAFSLIFKLIDQSDFRPPFGSAGGITLFINLLESDLEKGRKISVVNGLCLCSKEVVNRSKMRENGGLVKFLHFLQDNEMHIVHDRVISALLCYLYDDQSINILLENNVVSVLIGHLQRVAKFESYLEDVEMSTNDAIGEGAYREDMDEMNMGNEASYGMLMDVSVEDSCHMDEIDIQNSNVPKISVTKPMDQTMNDILTNESNGADSVDKKSCSLTMNTHTENATIADKTDCTESEKSSKILTSDIKSKHVFSIDSPSYEVNTDWNFDENGATSKQTFLATFDESPSTLSPLSTISYYSPTFSSPNYSPCQSPQRDSYSTLNSDPDYPTVCSTPYYIGSPEKQNSDSVSLGYSPGPSGEQQEFLYSDSEDDESVSSSCDSTSREDKKEGCFQKGVRKVEDDKRDNFNSKNICFGKDYNEKENSNHEMIDSSEKDNKKNEGNSSDERKENEKLNQMDISGSDFTIKPKSGEKKSEIFPSEEADTILKSTLKQLITKKRVNSSPELGSPSKRRKVAKTHRNSPTCTETHISMILSRVSQITDPSKYMVTKETIGCLLCYLSDVDKPETRIARVLSRLVRNPNCYEKFLHMNLPLLVFQKLLAGHLEIENLAFVKMALKNKNFLPQGGVYSSYRSRSDSVSSTSSDLSLLDLDDSLMNDLQSSPSKVKEATRSSAKDLESSRQESTEEQDGPPVTEGMSLRVKVGLSLLHDLFIMANSPFGRGIIAHWFARKETAKKLQCAVCLLYITWYSGMQQFYFFKLKILDDLLQILLDRKPVGLYNITLNGLVFLGKMLNLNVKLRSANLQELFINSNCQNTQNEGICVYSALSNRHDLILNVPETKHGGSDNQTRSLKACREILVKSSPMFAAMLEGHYSEAKQSEIKLTNTSLYAVRFILHYFHGCHLSCDTISDLLTCETTNRNLHKALEVLSLSHRYMLAELYHFLQAVICSRFLDSQNAHIVYEFALLHGFDDLAVDSVKAIFLDRSDDQAMRGIEKCLKGPTAEAFLNSVKTIVRNLCG